MLTEAKTYDELYRNFRWDIPARFNMATACCDRHADGSGRLALIYVDEDGATTRTSFDEVAEMSWNHLRGTEDVRTDLTKINTLSA